MDFGSGKIYVRSSLARGEHEATACWLDWHARQVRRLSDVIIEILGRESLIRGNFSSPTVSLSLVADLHLQSASTL